MVDVQDKAEPDLFFASSDSEDDDAPLPSSTTVVSRRSRDSPSSSNIAPASSNGASNGHVNESSSSSKVRSPDPEIVAVGGPSRRSPPKRPTPSRHGSSQRSRSVPADFSGYLGEFVCEGWSLSKGKGYCVPGSTVIFERPKPKKVVEDVGNRVEKVGPARLVNGKVVNAKSKTMTGKQVTLGSMGMGKKAAIAPGKKPPLKAVVDQIIRFRNDRGFEIGRLSVGEAGFLVHLLDTDIISLKGHVIDCPQVLSTGVTILLNVKVYLTANAFEQVEKDGREGAGTFWQEQKETTEEEAMRKRKDALGLLFGTCAPLIEALTDGSTNRENRSEGSAVQCTPHGAEEERFGGHQRRFLETLPRRCEFW